MTMNYYEIGQRIRKYRKAEGLSQERLAEFVGISTTHMSHIETGNTKLSLSALVGIAQALSVRTDDLLFAESCGKPTAIDEITALLGGCSEKECKILLDIMSAAKIAFEKYGER